MQSFSFEDFQQAASQSHTVAFSRVFDVGTVQSTTLYSLLKTYLQTEGVIFEDLTPEKQHRFSYLGFNPISTLVRFMKDQDNVITDLRHWIATHQYATRRDFADKISHLFGIFSYEMIRTIESIPAHSVPSTQPILFLQAYGLSLTIDHGLKKIYLSTIVPIDNHSSLLNLYHQTQHYLQSLEDHILIQCKPPSPTSKSTPSKGPKCAATVEVDTTDEAFIAKILQAKQLIQRGEVFQIVLSRCFKRSYSIDPLTIYQQLCETSPTRYMIYLPTSYGTFVAASPERFIQINDRHITVNPIAGTRQRRQNTSLDVIEHDLLNDPKECAEHYMLVDLARNDVGRVSLPGRVQVKSLLKVKHYSHVSHITSSVTGQLAPSFDKLDAFLAAFPAGTLTGAPKIRAMQHIDKLESSHRGWYGGAFCRFDADLNIDSAIAIRTAHLQHGIATIRTGAGIVQHSDPYSEANETRHKAQAVLDAIAEAHHRRT